MKGNSLNRRRRWDSGGVSEVVGTILTLAITVVLFSSIIGMVNQFPAPGDNVYTDFSATIEPRVNWTSGDSDWENGAYIYVTNVGGAVMTHLFARLILTVDSNTYTLYTKGSLANRTYGVGPFAAGHKGPDNGDDNWDTGETWSILFDYGAGPYQINENSNVGLMIVDIERNALIWTSSICGMHNQFGPVISEIWVDSDTRTIRHDPVQYGREFYLYAVVSDSDGDLNTNSVFADLSAINPTLSSVQLNDSDDDGIFESEAIPGPAMSALPVGYHIVIVNATDTAITPNTGRGVGRIPVGQDLGGQPNLVIFKKDLEVSTQNPVNGQNMHITATVKNFGGWCNGVMNFYDIVGSKPPDLIKSVNFTISDSPDQVTKTVSWVATPGGSHTLLVEALPIGAVDYFLGDNSNHTNITVMPTILLVDDDNHGADMSAYDTVSYMRAALDSGNFNYDLFIVGGGKQGPSYQYGDTSLKDYDVVIWMTGYESSDTLLTKDQENLTAYINDDLGMGRGGSLWLIGQHLFEDLDPGIVPFLTDQLKVAAKSPTLMSVPTNPMIGVSGNNISSEWATAAISIIDRVQEPEHDQSYQIQPDTSVGAETTFVVPPGTWADAINYENLTLDGRIVFFPWEFSRIQKTSDQAQVAYKVLLWLGNISIIFGHDLAISEQITEPSFVFFNQVVNVTAVIRNNGAENLTTDAILILDGTPLMDTLIRDINVSSMGGTITIWTTWTADQLGTHVLKWMVDPNNHIAETNENNNMVPSYVSTGEVYVEFRILVVDDDNSENNNGGSLWNETRYVTESLFRLGYSYESPDGDNTTYVVNTTDDGPPTSVLKDYSAVIWVTGEATSGLTGNDNNSLLTYLRNSNGRLWLIGQDLWSGIPDSNLSTWIGLQSVVPDAIISEYLAGVDDNPISHGMKIPIQDGSLADRFVPAAGAEGVFYQDAVNGTYSAVGYDEGSYQSLACGFNLSMLYGTEPGLVSGNNATDELTYMALRWFDKPETRKEARITLSDFYISDAHPQIGDAYILRATIHNVGAGTTNLLVRFMDGTTQIGADSISVEPDATTSAEIIWKPLFAGDRVLGILVDPIGEVTEIFEWFNNNITVPIYVYFFWDDMESGADKWSHGSTVININGEGPLDYYSSHAELNMDIHTEWDYDLSFGVDNTTREAHSYPKSFHMEEGEGLFGEADVLISFAIDDSRSMQNRYVDPPANTVSWLDRAKDAVLTLLEQLSDDSVCVSIWDFNGNNERRWSGPSENTTIPIVGRLQNDPQNHKVFERPPVRLGDTYNSTINGSQIDGRQFIRDEIIAMVNPPGQTILWDAAGEAYKDTEWFAAEYPELLPVVILLSDGCDSQASDQSPLSDNRIEGGSDYWCPWDDEANGTITYDFHRGKYTFDWENLLSSTQWLEAMNHGGSMEFTRTGMLHASLQIFTIGLGLEHHDPPWVPTLDTWPGEVPDDQHAQCTDTTVSPPCKESGTLEFNLWRIANTTGAEYFYAPDADALEDIFMHLGMFLASGFNQTRSPDPVGTRAVHDNFDKRAVTETVDLTDLESARLSFWHKYNMLQGGNGAFLQVAYKTSNLGDWQYKYFIPPGEYTGMLYHQETVWDDFGNLVQWCWNGLSGSGSLGWDYVDVDILPFVPEGAAADGHVYRSEVKVAFNYTQFGGGTGMGWYLDDVRLIVSRDDATAVDATVADVWALNNSIAHSGNHSWSSFDVTTGHMKPGVDNSLMTTPIDLTNAKNAYLSAYLKFNLNEASGSPPDGFRIEVSSDNGVCWSAINLGVRSSWGVSGTENDMEDGQDDGKAYTGLPETDVITDDYWVNASSLSRLNIDLSAWIGNPILIRVRVVNNNFPDLLYRHNNNDNYPDPGFGGFFIDDVIVYGETIFG